MTLEHLPVDLAELTYAVADLFRLQASDRRLDLLVRVATDVPRIALGDGGRIRQILTNLMGNALKFTESGHVLIELGWHEGSFVLAVSDTGIGIPPDRLDRLFTAFSQVDTSTSRKFGGTGLGLAISRSLATLMDGTLTVTSREGHGSTFTARLQLPISDDAREPPQPVLAGKRVLVIDDLALSRQITVEQLTLLGAAVTATDSVDRALADIRAASAAGQPWSAVILDLRRKSDDLVEAALRIRQDGAGAGLPLILYSIIQVIGETDRLEQAGFNGHLAKPAHQELLGALVAATIAHCRDHRPGVVNRHELFAPVKARSSPLPGIVADVLLVEDNEVNIKLGTAILRNLGVRVEIAVNGVEAVEMTSRNRYDLVFMDCQMPVMDGYAATAAIRVREREAGHQHLPIIAMTASAMPGTRENCLAAGMDDYVSKPVRARQFEDLLRRWLHNPVKTPSTPVATVRSAPALESDDQFDPALLRDIEAASPGLAVPILKSFRTDLEQSLPVIAEGCAQSDLETVGRKAHKLKGSSGSIGAVQVHAIAAALEQAARAGEADACRRHADALSQSARTFLAAITPESLPAQLTPNHAD